MEFLKEDIFKTRKNITFGDTQMQKKEKSLKDSIADDEIARLKLKVQVH